MVGMHIRIGYMVGKHGATVLSLMNVCRMVVIKRILLIQLIEPLQSSKKSDDAASIHFCFVTHELV